MAAAACHDRADAAGGSIISSGAPPSTGRTGANRDGVGQRDELESGTSTSTPGAATKMAVPSEAVGTRQRTL